MELSDTALSLLRHHLQRLSNLTGEFIPCPLCRKEAPND